jgi:hypothetical protein
MEHERKYIKMMRKRLIQEKSRVNALRYALAEQQLEAQANLANQQLVAQENLAVNNNDQVVPRADLYQCKICTDNTTAIMSCGECGFGACITCHDRRTSEQCYFCNTITWFQKCRLD